VKVAIANDSGLAAEALRRIVASCSTHVIAWIARDGDEAVRRCTEDRPDVVLMDLIMPVLNGAEATRLIMQRSPCAVLVVTSTVAGNFDLVCQALSHGAYDAVCTPVLGAAAPAKAGAELLAKLERVDRINRQLWKDEGGRMKDEKNDPIHPSSFNLHPSKCPLVAIGASTGGPAALEAILSSWPDQFPAAIVVAQHIAPDFAGSLVEWLNHRSKLTVLLAAAGDQPQAGIALVANGADHLIMTANRSWTYSAEPRECPYQPSVDALFRSLAAHWPGPAVAVLLTGIGRDGAQGLLELRGKGWHTIAQDEASSVVYGMPKAARDLGAAQVVLPLSQIGAHVATRLGVVN
jgi:two-component system, chemotaxis family, response regulator WspF